MFKKCSKILYSISLVSLSKKPALLLHSNDFKTRHKVLTGSIFSTVTVPVWHVTTSLWHHTPQDQRVAYVDYNWGM